MDSKTKKAPLEPVSNYLARSVVTLPRTTKRLVMLLADVVVLPTCLVAAVWLVTPDVLVALPAWLWVVPVVIGLPALRIWGFYRSVIRFMGFELVEAAVKGVTLVSFDCCFASRPSTHGPMPSGRAPRSGCSAWSTSSAAASRFVGCLQARNAAGDRVVIYGAGDAGAHLVTALRGRGEFVPVAFIDDNPTLHRSVINGLEVHSPHDLPNLIDEFGVSRVLLALPSVSRRRRLEIINQLEQLPVHVQTMPDTAISPPATRASTTSAKSTSRICSAAIRCRPNPEAARRVHPRQVRHGDRRRRLDRL